MFEREIFGIRLQNVETQSYSLPLTNYSRRDALLNSSRIRALLFLIDGALLNLAFVSAYFVRYRLQWFRAVEFDAPFVEYLPILALFNLVCLAVFWLDGVFAMRHTASWIDQTNTLIGSTIKVLFIMWSVIFLTRPQTYSQLMIAEAGAITVIFLSLARWVKNQVEARLRAKDIGVSNVLIVGAGEIGRAVMRTVFARPELGYRCMGFVDDDPQRGQTNIGRFLALGQTDALPNVLSTLPVDEVVVTLPWSAMPKILDIVSLCQKANVRARVVPSILQINFSKIDVDDFGGIPMLGLRERTISPVARLSKRAFDLFFGGLILLLMMPVMVFAAIAIRLESAGSPIFSQLRAGQDGKPFKIYKLRSMKQGAEEEREHLEALNEADGPMFKLREDPRRTRVGAVLRKFSIDELPQFWNVIKGEMSIIGPRPALLKEVDQYREWHHERLRVKPGISGLWQISGRNELSFDEMVLLDMYYIENRNLLLDFKIMLQTVPYLFSGRGAY